MSKKLHIKRIEKPMSIVAFQVEPWRYDEQRADFERDHGIRLPSLRGLKTIGKVSELRVLDQYVKIRYLLSDGRWLQWEFFPGWIWDLASVPWFFRSLIDNDDVFMSEAAIVHDSNYTGHFLGDNLPGLDFTNWLFRETVRFRGRRVRARLAFIAVNSVIGRSLYWKKSTRASATLRFVHFSQGRTTLQVVT
jgi:hypothetical protein